MLTDVTFIGISDICEYIKTTFSIEYSRSGLHKWLHRSNFSYKQFKGVVHKFGQDKQAQFNE
ncbi:MAG: winged helix-turn-helix domain-containing protein [Psychromonas sp.]|nr:winged helix-turn-helix domain-containing protein [Psychromonas sp.]